MKKMTFCLGLLCVGFVALTQCTPIPVRACYPRCSAGFECNNYSGRCEAGDPPQEPWPGQ